MSEPQTLSGKVIAITGAAGGMGIATSRLLAARGAKLSLADVSGPGLEALSSSLRSSFGAENIHSTVVNVRSTEEVNNWITQTLATFGRLDGAVNMAGMLVHSARGITGTSEEQWEETLDVNLTGMFRCVRAELDAIADGGSIVNVASIAGISSLPTNPAYAASKHGVVGLTRSVAKDPKVGGRQVRVNAIAPGAVDTPMAQDGSGGHAEEIVKQIGAFLAIRRVGKPEEVASLAAFLLGDESKYITGAVHVIDGGWTC